jgi:hypothetical protein
MPEIIRTVVAGNKEWLGPAAALFVSLGVTLMIGGGVYRVFIRPEWTTVQALDALWPFFLAGVITLVLGLLLDRAES